MTSGTHVNSALAITSAGAPTPNMMSLSEQLDDALAEHFWIREYIELVENGHQYAHNRIHYYDDKLRLNFWPSIGSGVQPVAPENRQGYQIGRGRAADTLPNRRAQWTADDGENKEEASEEADSEDVESHGEVSEGDVKEDEEDQSVTQAAATDKNGRRTHVRRKRRSLSSRSNRRRS